MGQTHIQKSNAHNVTEITENYKTLSFIHVYVSPNRSNVYNILRSTGVLISPYPDQEGKKLQQQRILMFIYPIYNHNWRYINTIYIYNKTSIERNILTIKRNSSGSKSG